MKKHTVIIEDDVYDFLGVQADLFESMSDVLRKLLPIEGTTSKPMPGRRKTSMVGFKFPKRRCSVCHKLVSSNAYERHLKGAPHAREVAKLEAEAVEESQMEFERSLDEGAGEGEKAAQKRSAEIADEVRSRMPEPPVIVPDRHAGDLVDCPFCDKRSSPQGLNLHVYRGHQSQYKQWRREVNKKVGKPAIAKS